MIAVLVLALSLFAPTSAQAFMTWNSPGNAEHERVTRFGLACVSPLDRVNPDGATWANDLCLPSEVNPVPGQYERTLRMVAGANGYFGGVGAPDRFYESVISSSDRAHCDNADAWFASIAWPLNNGVYPRSPLSRESALHECLMLLQTYVAKSVEQAGLLVNADGTLNAGQTDLSDDCNVDYDPDLAPDETHSTGAAKCNALISFGRALHITEDFFSHSNWVDQNPTTPGPKDPPGLENGLDHMPSALRYPQTSQQIDDFLAANQVITGAYPTPSGILPPPTRMYHNNFLNKDEGDGKINWSTGEIPKGDGGHSGRATAGVIDGQDNFQRAVRSAATAASLLWADFHTAILTTYGTDRGTKIWNAIRANTPWTACKQGGQARRAIGPPNFESSARRTVQVTVVNNTSSTMNCGSVLLDFGEWSSLPPDQIAPGASAKFLALSNGSDATASVDMGLFRLYFDNPLIGSNTYRCTPVVNFSCKIAGGSGNDARVTVTVSSNRDKSDTVSVKKDVPSRAHDGIGKQDSDAAHDHDSTVHHTMDSLNDEASNANQAQLDVELVHIKKCEGEGADIHLSTDDISCADAFQLMTDVGSGRYERFCPHHWKVIYDPKGVNAPEGAILCHQDEGADSNPDQRARAFWYVLPHALGGNQK